MIYLSNLPLEKGFKQGLSLDQLVVLKSMHTFISSGNPAKMSYNYIGTKLLNKGVKAAERIVNQLVEDGWIYKKSGKYENKKKQEANEYTLSPKCNKLFSTVKTTIPSTVKTTNNIKNKKEERAAGLNAAFLQKYREHLNSKQNDT